MIKKNDERKGSEEFMAVNGLNFEKPDELWLEEVKGQTQQAVEAFLDVAKMKAGQILVVGCSSSEIAAQKIGSFSSDVT